MAAASSASLVQQSEPGRYLVQKQRRHIFPVLSGAGFPPAPAVELPAGEQHPGLLERAFPVRDEDAVEPLWEKLKYQAEGARLVPGAESVVDAIEQVVLTQSDVQVFREEIDVVRFPVTMPEEYWQMLASYDHNAKTVPEVKNADALAASVIGQLQERLG